MEQRYSVVPNVPPIGNLMEMFSIVTGGQSFADIERDFEGKGYAEFKIALADAVVDYVRPVRERFLENSCRCA